MAEQTDNPGGINWRSLSRYKYQLLEDYIILVPWLTGSLRKISGFIELDERGRLLIRKGYCWDGPSGPTVDTTTAMRGSLVHDAIYQLFRAGKLPIMLRERADRLYSDLCKEDGMSPWRCATHLYFLTLFGGNAAKLDTT